MSDVKVRDGLACPRCPEGPFKNRAGLGAHMAAKHGVRLDGSRANGQHRRKGRLTHEVIATIKDQQVTLTLSQDEMRDLLVKHPEALIDSLME